MARGHPDWQPSRDVSLADIRDVNVAKSTSGTTNTLLWDPGAGARVRVIQYHFSLTLAADAGATDALFTAEIAIRSVTTPSDVLDRAKIALYALANTMQNGVLDTGLCVLGGGGYVFPVDHSIEVSYTLGIGSGFADSFLAGHIGGVEEVP